MKQPDHAELERAVVSYLSTHPIEDANLRVQVEPFERGQWPPEPATFVSELFLIAPAASRNARSKLQEVLSRVRDGVESGETALPGCAAEAKPRLAILVLY